MEGVRERGYEQSLMAPASSPLAGTMRNQGFEVHSLSSPATSIANLKALRGLAGGFDILHAHDSHGHSLAWLAGIARGHRSWPLLVVARRVAFPIGSFGGSKYAAANAYIAVSDYVRQQLLKAKVPRGKIHVVHDGVKPPLAAVRGVQRSEFRRRYGVDDHSLLLGTLTSFAPEKLLREEIDLLEVLPPSVHLWIGRAATDPGPRSEEAELLRYAKDRGVEHRVQFLALGDDLDEFLDSLDVFLYLSRSEGLGSAILLAMAHGLPVVASRVGGIPEIVRHRETGLLVGDNLKEELPAAISLLNSEELRLKLSGAGQKFVLDNCSAGAMVSKTIPIYEELLNGSLPTKSSLQSPTLDSLAHHERSLKGKS